jgi:hypothetical protein
MSKRKRNKNKNNYDSDDIRDIRSKGQRKHKQKARRHDDKNFLKQIQNEMNANPEEFKKYMDYMD